MVHKATVLMPVYNAEQYLHEAIDSILSQTYTDFEFIVINDGSTDNSLNVIESYDDKRIKLINNAKNMGLICSLNAGLDLINSDYIVRMDADDVSFPERLQKQIDFMDANPEIGISGSWLLFFRNGEESVWRAPITPELTRCNLLFESSIPHPTSIMKTSMINRYNLRYDANYKHAEDYALWVSASRCFPITNFGEVLLHYRVHSEQVGNKHGTMQNTNTNLIREKLIMELGFHPTQEEIVIHNIVRSLKQFDDREVLIRIKLWLEKLVEFNKTEKVFPVAELSKFIAEKWFKVCYNSSHFGIWTLKQYNNSYLCNLYKPDLWSWSKFMGKCGLSHRSV